MNKKVTSNAKEVVLSALDKYYDFIAPTYGPAGRKILIDNGINVRSVDDGKIASQEFELKDELENAVIRYVRQASSETDERVGDGTTTSAIITIETSRSILRSGEFQKEKNIHSEIVGLTKALPEAIKQIKKTSKQVKSKDELFAVAHNSYNDTVIAKLISDTIYEIGKNGFVSVEDSRAVTTEREIVNGLQLEKGLVSPYFINNEKGQAVVNGPAILVANQKLDTFKALIPCITSLLESGKKEFVIVADSFGDEVINNIIVNNLKGMFSALLVEAPGYGSQKTQFIQDIAVVVGATVVDTKKGDSLESVQLSSLGSAELVRVDKTSTVFINGVGNKKMISERVKLLQTELENANNPFEKEGLEKRIAQLGGGIAVIRVGALTEGEQKTKRAKIEDAVNATKAAFKGGLSAGAGRTFENIKTSSETLNKVLKSPREVLEKNGLEWLDENTVDPTDVLIASLETAISTACGLVALSGIVATEREEKDK